MAGSHTRPTSASASSASSRGSSSTGSSSSVAMHTTHGTPPHSRPSSASRRTKKAHVPALRTNDPDLEFPLVMSPLATPTTRTARTEHTALSATQRSAGATCITTREGLVRSSSAVFSTAPRVPKSESATAGAVDTVPMLSGLGPQLLSQFTSAAIVTIGTSTREDCMPAHLRHADACAGPGSYNSAESVGSQIESSKRSMPAMSIPTELRFKRNSVATPGPDLLPNHVWRPNAPKYSFGTSTREAAVDGKVVSPGPMYSADEAAKKMVLRRSSSASFTTSQRFKRQDAPSVQTQLNVSMAPVRRRVAAFKFSTAPRFA